MKRNRAQSALVIGVVALLCVVVAIGAGLQGQFTFSGPRWDPGDGTLPPPKVNQTPVPVDTATTGKPAPVGATIVLSWLPIVIVLACMLVAVLVLLVLYWLRHRRARAETFLLAVESEFEGSNDVSDIEVDADLPTLQRGLVRASAALEEYREPRDAIVRAWIGLQDAADESGLRRRLSETPTEFTTRVFDSVSADRSAAAALLEVYLRVRFRSAPATDADVVVARTAIERLRETWPVTTPE